MSAITSQTTPITDEENPFYCPSITAVAFLESVREKVYSETNIRGGRRGSAHTPDFSRSTDQFLFPSFETVLDRSLDENDLLQLHYVPRNASTRLRHKSSSSSLKTDDLYSVPSWKNNGAKHISSLKPGSRDIPPTRSSRPTRLQTSDTFSEFRGPFRHQQSSMSVNEGSFELSAKAERLHFFPAKPIYSPSGADKKVASDQLAVHVRMLEDELYGPQIGTETPRGLNTFVRRLEALLPGVRLKERLRSQDANTHQRIVDALSADGSLNARVLDLLRMSEIKCLDLATSMTDEDGLNLDAREILHVFSRPNSFVFLSEINLSGARLNSSDLKHVHHLPRLARLWISNTGIGNEAIFHLVSLKRSLTELDIAFNHDVDDDAVPALILLHKLRFLTILDTRVRMHGLRRLCAAVAKRKHSLDLEVPRQCEIYVEKMGNKYVLHPEAPLISDHKVVPELSTVALKRNLTAHAQYNSDILAEGSKREMAERLKTLLEVREADLIVRDVLWKNDREDEDESNDEIF